MLKEVLTLIKNSLKRWRNYIIILIKWSIKLTILKSNLDEYRKFKKVRNNILIIT